MKRVMLEELPREIRSQIGGYIANDLQAVDPRCYRAARSMQALWRGWATRFQRWRCNFCEKRVFLGVTMTRYSGRVYARVSFAVLPLWIARKYMGRIPLSCASCRWRTILRTKA